MSAEPYSYIDSDGDRMNLHEAGKSVYVEVTDSTRKVTAAVSVPADERRSAAEALAGPDHRVVPRDLTIGDLAQIARDAGVRLDMDLRDQHEPDRPEPVDPASVDPEIAALHQIVAAMSTLDSQQQARTVRYLSARYGDADSFIEQLTGHRGARDE